MDNMSRHCSTAAKSCENGQYEMTLKFPQHCTATTEHSQMKKLKDGTECRIQELGFKMTSTAGYYCTEIIN